MKSFLKTKKLRFAVGLILFITSFISFLLLGFAFRDFSFVLLLQFLFTLIFYPVSIAIMYKYRPVFTPSLISEGEDGTLHRYDADGKIEKVERK